MLKLLVFAASLGAAVPSAAEPPADAAQIDRLLEVVPHYREDVDRAPDPQDVAEVQALNPGRAEEVRQLLEAKARCESAVIGPSLRNAFLEMGRRLGRGKIDRLIAFYSGPDFQAFTSIQDRTEQGESISRAEAATMERILRDYPLIEMGGLLSTGELTTAGNPNLFEYFEHCLIETATAFESAGLRLAPEQAR